MDLERVRYKIDYTALCRVRVVWLNEDYEKYLHERTNATRTKRALQ